MNRLLAIDTSSEACSLALQADGGVLEYHEHAPLKHAELLLPAVQQLLANAGLQLSALDAIAFGRGPGSFTSLRIGIGVVQGLAWAAGLPVVPVSSLAALALEAGQQAARDEALIRVAVDARMQEVFTADYAWHDGWPELRGEERVCAPGNAAEAPESSGRPLLVVGNGFERFPELEPLGRAADASYPDLWPRATMILRLGERWLQSHDPLPAARAQPVYIRDKVAEKPTP
jgi:tRNA threonylcarbamoyladenosine biosynthesis protein TsaB